MEGVKRSRSGSARRAAGGRCEETRTLLTSATGIRHFQQARMRVSRPCRWSGGNMLTDVVLPFQLLDCPMLLVSSLRLTLLWVASQAGGDGALVLPAASRAAREGVDLPGLLDTGLCDVAMSEGSINAIGSCTRFAVVRASPASLGAYSSRSSRAPVGRSMLRSLAVE